MSRSHLCKSVIIATFVLVNMSQLPLEWAKHLLSLGLATAVTALISPDGLASLARSLLTDEPATFVTEVETLLSILSR